MPLGLASTEGLGLTRRNLRRLRCQGRQDSSYESPDGYACYPREKEQVEFVVDDNYLGRLTTTILAG